MSRITIKYLTFKDNGNKIEENETDYPLDITDDQLKVLSVIVNSRELNLAGGDISNTDLNIFKNLMQADRSFFDKFLYRDDEELGPTEVLESVLRLSGYYVVFENFEYAGMIADWFFDYDRQSLVNPDGPINGGGVIGYTIVT
jgi:hypothetical protein